MIVDKFTATRYNLRNNPSRVKGCSNMTEILTVEQVAQELQVNPKTVYQWIKEKRLKATNIGTRTKANWRIRRQDLNEFLDQGNTNT
jgi:excisionase family DNA binding protein